MRPSRGGRPASRGRIWAQGVRGSHAITDGVTRGRDVALRADIPSTVEFVMAPSMTVETGSPIVHVRVRKGFVILG